MGYRGKEGQNWEPFAVGHNLVPSQDVYVPCHLRDTWTPELPSFSALPALYWEKKWKINDTHTTTTTTKTTTTNGSTLGATAR